MAFERFTNLCFRAPPQSAQLWRPKTGLRILLSHVDTRRVQIVSEMITTTRYLFIYKIKCFPFAFVSIKSAVKCRAPTAAVSRRRNCINYRHRHPRWLVVLLLCYHLTTRHDDWEFSCVKSWWGNISFLIASLEATLSALRLHNPQLTTHKSWIKVTKFYI